MEKWLIIYSDYEQEKRALQLLNGKLREKIDFPTECVEASAVTQEHLTKYHLILVGTANKNPIIRELIENKILESCSLPQQYFIFVGENYYNPEKMMMVASGFDSNGVLYGAVDLVNLYLGDKVHDTKGYNIVDSRFYTTAFVQKTPAFQRLSAPHVQERGIWCWAHCIYDYRKFFEHMMMLKLNLVVVWTDFAPLNAKEVVEYAHSCGIKLIWGYSWGWETGSRVVADFSDPTVQAEWAEKIIGKYETEFMSTGCDGIYFQTFTERKENNVNGKCVAETVTQWVNYVFEKMRARHPLLRVQFGLHATSVKEDTEYLKGVHKDMDIVWEDCGAFPYAYYPNVNERKETLDFSAKISTLRGLDDKFSVVLKGMTTLNWATFEHQTGPYMMGCDTAHYVTNRSQEKRKVWRLFQSEWLTKYPYVSELIKHFLLTRKGDFGVQMLVEDGLFEDQIWLPVALLSECLWQSDLSDDELITRVARFPNVEFA